MRIGSHFFAYLSRMRFIQRWALMRNTAPENVQEHSHHQQNISLNISLCA